MIYTITIPGRLPGLNDMIRQAKQGRRNYQPYALQKAIHTDTVACLCKAAHIPRLERVAVRAYWMEPNRKRDPDNVTAAIKYILDGMVKANVIPDDNQRHVDTIFHKVDVDKHNPRIVVEIEEV